jgi:hypothetical protein
MGEKLEDAAIGRFYPYRNLGAESNGIRHRPMQEIS